jgi:hypothetical protein
MGVILCYLDHKRLGIEVKHRMQGSIECNGLGTAAYILESEIRITQQGIVISRTRYIKNILDGFRFQIVDLSVLQC